MSPPCRRVTVPTGSRTPGRGRCAAKPRAARKEKARSGAPYLLPDIEHDQRRLFPVDHDRSVVRVAWRGKTQRWGNGRHRGERPLPGHPAPPAPAPGGPRALTGLLRLRAVLDAAEDAGQAGLADAVLAQQDHLVEPPVRVAARRDDGVGGVGGPALPVRLAGAVGGAAHQAGQLVVRQGGPQVPLVHRHAAPVQVLVRREGHAAAPLLQRAELGAAVQGHGDAGLLREAAPLVPRRAPEGERGEKRGEESRASPLPQLAAGAAAASPLFMARPGPAPP